MSLISHKSFTKLLQAKCPSYIRLSIHPSTGTVKLSIPLIDTATGEFPRTPWHSSLALALDGSYSTVHSKNVRDTHTLIRRDDCEASPYFYREKSELWDWGEDAGVVFEPRYPNCLIVRPSSLGAGEDKRLDKAQVEKLRDLVNVHTAGPLVVKGFVNGDEVGMWQAAEAVAATAAAASATA